MQAQTLYQVNAGILSNPRHWSCLVTWAVASWVWFGRLLWQGWAVLSQVPFILPFHPHKPSMTFWSMDRSTELSFLPSMITLLLKNAMHCAPSFLLSSIPFFLSFFFHASVFYFLF